MPFAHGKSKSFIKKLGKGKTPTKEECERFFADKDNLDAIDPVNGTALIYAAQYGQIEIARGLISAGAKLDMKGWNLNTPLIWAVQTGNQNLVSMLIDAGANLDTHATFHNTPLMDAVDLNLPEIAHLLIVSGADLNITNNTYTALMNAVSQGKSYMVEMLANAGADMKINNQVGGTVLIQAVQHNQPNMVRILLAAGADVNAVDASSHNALWYAQEHKLSDIAQMLIQYGAVDERELAARRIAEAKAKGYQARFTVIGPNKGVILLPALPLFGALVSYTSLPQAENGLNNFNLAIQASNNQQYMDSITHFENAISDGLGTLRAGYAYSMMGKIKLLEFNDIEEAAADLAKALSFSEMLYETAHTAVQYLYTFYKIADANDEAFRITRLYDATRGHLDYSLDPAVTTRVQHMLSGIKWRRE